jgi:urea carboxylase
MLAKLIVHAPDREGAIAAMQRRSTASRIDGIETNLRWLRDVVRTRASPAARSPPGARQIAYAPRASA